MDPLIASFVAFGCALVLLHLTRKSRAKRWWVNLILLLTALFVSTVVSAIISPDPRLGARYLGRIWFWYLVSLALFKLVASLCSLLSSSREPTGALTRPEQAIVKLLAYIKSFSARTKRKQPPGSFDGIPDAPIGGIESIIVDGRPLYFGFSYSSDTVLSPLIEDRVAMAAFAASHMAQRDGNHGLEYWLELVDASLEESGLSEEREFSSAEIRRLPEVLARIVATSQPDKAATLDYHLQYLLEAALDDARADALYSSLGRLFATEQAQRLGFDAESSLRAGDIERLFAICCGASPPPGNASCSDAAYVLKAYFDLQLSHLNFNWETLFR